MTVVNRASCDTKTSQENNNIWKFGGKNSTTQCVTLTESMHSFVFLVLSVD